MDWGNHVSVVEHREPSQEWAHFDRTILQANPGSSFTLVFPLADNRVLLGLKKRGFGQGLMNGFGGKVKPGESIEDAAVRELEEECGLCVNCSSLETRGQLIIVRPLKGAPPVIAQLFIFTCKEWSGHTAESEEMKPQWFVVDQLPFDNMVREEWPEARLYLPLILGNGCHSARTPGISGTFQYAADNNGTLDGWWLGITTGGLD